jgi:hypothetical protein
MRLRPAGNIRATTGPADLCAGRNSRQDDLIGYRAIVVLNACARWKKLRVS